jgi:hypothetical protein
VAFNARTRGHHLVTVERLSGDEYDTAAGPNTSAETDGTWEDTDCSVTWTPPDTANWIIVARAELSQATAPYRSGVRLAVVTSGGSVYYGDMTMTIQTSASERRGWMWVQRVSLSNESETVKIQFRNVDGVSGSASIRDMNLWIFREDDFEDGQFKRHEGLEGTNSTSFGASSCTHTFTPSGAGDYLILASAITVGGNHATYRGEHKLVIDGTSKGTDAIKSGVSTPTNNEYCYGYGEVVTLDADSTVLEWQFRKSGSGLGTYCAFDDQTIAALRFPVAADRIVAARGIVGAKDRIVTACPSRR